MKIRIPKDAEYLELCDITNGNDALMHWHDIACWVDDADKPLPCPHIGYRANRGCTSARDWNYTGATYRRVDVGFRPAVEGLNIVDSLTPDTDGLVVLGTLYMNGEPVRVPQKPTWTGDITNYIHCAELEMKDPLEDPDYQVKGFIIGDGVAIADRVLLKDISYRDIKNCANCAKKYAIEEITEALKKAVPVHVKQSGVPQMVTATVSVDTLEAALRALVESNKD